MNDKKCRKWKIQQIFAFQNRRVAVHLTLFLSWSARIMCGRSLSGRPWIFFCYRSYPQRMESSFSYGQWFQPRWKMYFGITSWKFVRKWEIRSCHWPDACTYRPSYCSIVTSWVKNSMLWEWPGATFVPRRENGMLRWWKYESNRDVLIVVHLNVSIMYIWTFYFIYSEYFWLYFRK